MATPLERPKTPISVIAIGVVVAVLIGLILLRWLIGFVITITKIGIAAAIVIAIVVAITRLIDTDD